MGKQKVVYREFRIVPVKAKSFPRIRLAGGKVEARFRSAAAQVSASSAERALACNVDDWPEVVAELPDGRLLGRAGEAYVMVSPV